MSPLDPEASTVGRAFPELWHARAFVLVETLIERGHFTRAEWTQALGAEIRDDGPRGDSSAGESAYYHQLLAALEKLVTSRGLTNAVELHGRVDAWRRAYLRTPHGMAVVLPAPPSG